MKNKPKNIESPRLAFLDGKFQGLHLIKKGYCPSCDAEQQNCIYATKKSEFVYNR